MPIEDEFKDDGFKMSHCGGLNGWLESCVKNI